jgi:hypothetical protein
MLHDDFGKIFEELKGSYPQAFTERIAQRMWDFCQLIDKAALNAAIDHIQETGQKLSVSSIRTQCLSSINRAKNEMKSMQLAELAETGLTCASCYNSGTILAKSKINGASYAFRCPCQYGAISGFNHQSWGPQFEKDFDIERIETSGWKEIKRKNPRANFIKYLMSIIRAPGSAIKDISGRRLEINLEEIPF